jgi:ketosteroid isomerase-like protein
MAERKEILKKFMELQEKRDFDAAAELISDDITVTAPMAGTTTGKAAVKASWQSMPAGPKLDWSEPTEEGDTLTTTATSPFGRLTMLVTFGGDKISKVEIKMG